MYISRTTVLSPAALTIGQKVSFVTSVTCPTVAPAVSRLDLTFPTTPFLLLFLALEMELTVFNDDDSNETKELEVEGTL